MVCARCSTRKALPVDMPGKPQKFRSRESLDTPHRCCDRCYRLAGSESADPTTSVILPSD